LSHDGADKHVVEWQAGQGIRHQLDALGQWQVPINQYQITATQPTEPAPRASKRFVAHLDRKLFSQ
jgi:hypothetical protein